MKTNDRTSAGEAGSHVPCPWARTAFAGGKEDFTSPWCWVTFGEQSKVISPERRRSLAAPGGDRSRTIVLYWRA
jgi:hypothetical protein